MLRRLISLTGDTSERNLFMTLKGRAFLGHLLKDKISPFD